MIDSTDLQVTELAAALEWNDAHLAYLLATAEAQASVRELCAVGAALQVKQQPTDEFNASVLHALRREGLVQTAYSDAAAPIPASDSMLTRSLGAALVLVFATSAVFLALLATGVRGTGAQIAPLAIAALAAGTMVSLYELTRSADVDRPGAGLPSSNRQSG